MRREKAEEIRERTMKAHVWAPTPEFHLLLIKAGYEQALKDHRIGKYHDKNEINKL